MRKIFSLLLLFIFVYSANAQFTKINNTAFKRGESIQYRVHYGFVDAFDAKIEITDENKKFGNRNTMHIVGTGWSKGSFEFFFKIRDRYESYIDEDALLPWMFVRRVNEGGYKINQNYVFNHFTNTIDCDGKKVTMKENVQDMISSFYYARCYDLGSAKINQIFTVPTIIDGEFYSLQIKFKGREDVDTKFGKISCLKFVPIVQKGRIFKNENDLNVWITDDANHLPVKVKAKIIFGALNMDLLSYSGLANPIVFK